MANNFTDQVYKKIRTVIATQKFEGDWQTFIKTSVGASGLLSETGLSTAHAEGPEKLRQEIIKKAKGTKKKASASATADTIIAAAKPGSPDTSWQERAAAIKMLKHLYRYEKRGAQDVWIYSPPKAYKKWIFAELVGDEKAVKGRLKKETEIYTDSDKKTMCSALKIALTCSQKAVKLLGTPNAETLAVVKRWFGGADDAKVKADAKTLLDGFKKVSNLCNSNKLIFPDDPNDRKSMSSYGKLYGSVWPGGEGMFPVIYLAGAFKKAGNSGKLWLCAQTIIHEATHLELRTKDHRYDTRGLKISTAFPHDKAIENADSWGYFCIDLCGYLSKSDLKKVLK